MLSTELKSKINQLWDKFWSRGITNPINAIEQISYLLFMRRIDDTDNAEKGANSIFEGKEDYRWSSFTKLDPDKMLQVVTNEAFPFIKNLNDPAQPYTRHMQNAIFFINNSTLLKEAVEAIDEIYSIIQQEQEAGQHFQDIQGDVYEYLIS